MKKEYLQQIKQENGWFFDEEFKPNLVVTDDLDSILSALMLMQYRPHWQIGYFYDFREGLYQKLDIDESLPMVGVDLSHPTMRCISNHVVKVRSTDKVNVNDINLNIIDNICVKNYHSKYNLNTLLLVYSLLGLNVIDKVEAATLLLPDSAFLPYYANPTYKDSRIQKYYLCDVLELPEVWEVQKDITKGKFKSGQEILNIKSKLTVDDKGITTVENVDIKRICDILKINFEPSMMEGFFMLTERHQSYSASVFDTIGRNNLFSFAVTSKKRVKYSKKV